MNLWAAFAESARRHAGREAIVQGDRRTTYDEWLRRAVDYAAAIERAGVRRNDRVLVWMGNSAEMAAALFGVWAAGAIAVLLHSASRAPHVAHAIATTAPALILRAPTLAFPAVSFSCPALDAPDVHAGTPSRAAEPALPTEPACIMFTSGSTGPPKGVTHSHGGLLGAAQVIVSYHGIVVDDRVVCPLPWAFTTGCGHLLTTALAGVTHILPVDVNPFELCDAIERHRPTVFGAISTWLTYLLRGVSPLRRTALSSLRIVTTSGGVIPMPVMRDMLDVFAHCRIFLNFGLTETIRTSCLDPALARSHPRSVGRAIPGVSLAVLREDGSAAAPEEEGEIVHRGAHLAMGYWNDPSATALAFRPDPLSPRGCPNPRRAMFTGDSGHLDADGLLYYHGRRDQQLKTMGLRVAPGEIEEALHASGLVREVAVFGRPHDLLGDEVWAVVALRDGGDDVPARLRAYAREVLSEYMRPQRYLFRSTLPRTPSGKIDYTALKEEADRAPSAALTPAVEDSP